MLKLVFVLPGLLLFALSPQPPAAAPAPAAMPADAATLVNPIKPTAESQARAKKVYGYDCAMCHGANGNGKGDLVADMKLNLKDYTDPAALKDMPDGEIFYIIKNGKGQMSGEGDRAKPEDLWNMVVLVRSFAKK
jgi:mono/diheme cytochrome c family protein